MITTADKPGNPHPSFPGKPEIIESRGDMTKENTPAAKWILPPHLKRRFDDFISLYNMVFKNPKKRRRPILIHGAPGVGKSLFSHVFEVLYRKDYPGKLGINDVKRLNVSALAENLFESEIFGHVKGAFTGALKEKIGFLENTKLLILEEIGELSKTTQAKLLTFMEDGIYYRVGENTPGKSADDIQIIATTNAPLDAEHFRPDFLDRCYVFHVPALHERRGDILYILADQYPDLFKNFSQSEIMLILCYNWPGNMREIEKFGATGRATYCQKNFLSLALTGKPVDPFEDITRLEKMLSRLSAMGIDDNDYNFEKFLNRGRLSLNATRDYPLESCSNHLLPQRKKMIAFKDIKLVQRNVIEFNEVLTIDRDPNIDKTLYYFLFFPLILHVKVAANADLYDIDEIYSNAEFYDCSQLDTADLLFSTYLPKEPQKYVKLYKKWLLKAMNYGIERHFKSPSDDFARPFDLSYGLTENDLLKSYYAELLNRYEGNVAEVARHAGINRNTLDSRLKKRNIPLTSR